MSKDAWWEDRRRTFAADPVEEDPYLLVGHRDDLAVHYQAHVVKHSKVS